MQAFITKGLLAKARTRITFRAESSYFLSCFYFIFTQNLYCFIFTHLLNSICLEKFNRIFCNIYDFRIYRVMSYFLMNIRYLQSINNKAPYCSHEIFLHSDLSKYNIFNQIKPTFEGQITKYVCRFFNFNIGSTLKSIVIGNISL